MQPLSDRITSMVRPGILLNSSRIALMRLTYSVKSFFNRFVNIELYKLKSTCYFNEQMEYCPVLVELTDEMKGFYGGANFLLQVWDSNAEKVYERCLKSKTNLIDSLEEVLIWNIFFNFFAFKLQEPD